MFSSWFTQRKVSMKKNSLFCLDCLYAEKTHHFFLTMVSSIHVILEILVSKLRILLIISPSFKKTTFPPPFELRSLRNEGNG